MPSARQRAKDRRALELTQEVLDILEDLCSGQEEFHSLLLELQSVELYKANRSYRCVIDRFFEVSGAPGG